MKLSTILPLITSVSASCIRGTSLLPRAADGTVDVNSFNYTNLGGPLTWYGLDEANSACSEGKNQSPIDIVTDDIDYVTPGSLHFHVPPVTEDVTFENLGSGLEVVLTNGTLVAGGKHYKLAQFHFHTPSEHRVNEEYFPMEVHFVFEDADSNIAVVGFVFQLSELGYSFPLFDSVFAHMDDVAAPGSFVNISGLYFDQLTAHLYQHGIYEYSGSLTTPPCSEGVAWYISTEPLPLNVQSYNKVKSILKFNARFTQNALGQENLLEVAAKELN